MSTDERYDGEVHGLLATAFSDDGGNGTITSPHPVAISVESHTYLASPPRPLDCDSPTRYDGVVNGVKYRFSISVMEKNGVYGAGCTSDSCPPNRTLAHGLAATALTTSGPEHAVVIHYDAEHSVMVRAFLTARTTAADVPFHFEKLIADPRFAQLIVDDVRTLNRLAHPA